MSEFELWTDLVGRGSHELRATPRATINPDEVLPPRIHEHDRAAASMVLILAAATPGFSTTLLVRSLHADHQGRLRLDIHSDSQNVLVTTTADDVDDDYDPLTGLPGVDLLRDRIDQSLLTAGRTGRMVGLLLIDIDGLGSTNDTYGHAAGDRVILALAQHLERALRPSDTLARVGGDDFLVVAPGLRSPADAAVVAERVLAALPQIDDLPGGVPLTASIGISIGDATTDAAQLLRDAHTAVQSAQTAGGNRWLLHGWSASDSPALTLDHQVRVALDEHTIDAWYQPILDEDGELRRLDACVTIYDALGDRIPADDVIFIAERSRLVTRLDHRVAERVIQHLAAWERDGLTLSASVNIALGTITQLDFAAVVAAVQAREGLAAGRLVIDVPSVALDHPVAQRCLNELRAVGAAVVADHWRGDRRTARFAIDAGVDEIKVDRTVVTHLLTTVPGELADAIRELRSAGIVVSAVGVENDEQRVILKELGCSLLQGHLLGRPATATEIESRLRDVS